MCSFKPPIEHGPATLVSTSTVVYTLNILSRCPQSGHTAGQPDKCVFRACEKHHPIQIMSLREIILYYVWAEAELVKNSGGCDSFVRWKIHYIIVVMMSL